MKKTSLKATLALFALGALVTAKASPYTETDSAITTSLPTIDGSDLILNMAPTLDTSEHGVPPGNGYDPTDNPSNPDPGHITTNAVLTNGQLGALGSYTDGQEYYITDLTDVSPQSAYSAVLSYSLGVNPLGYDVNEVQSITQWGNNGRVYQDYTVAFSFDGGLTYGTTAGVNLFNVNYANSNPNVGENVTLTGLNLTGVTDVEFTFGSQENNAVGYSELAVDGTAVGEVAAPEPSSMALLFLGGGCLIYFFRMRSQQV